MEFEHKVYELNYSKIKTYKECPLLYKYKYVEGKREGLVPASSLGVSIHRTLEEYHKYSNDPSEILNYFNNCWLGAGYTSAGEQMEYYLKGKKMLEAYAEKEYERKTSVDSTEREFIFEHGIWTIRGKIDRTDLWPDGSWEVIDYKTGSELDENFDVTQSLQMGIYSVGARRAWNMKKGKASIYNVALGIVYSADFDLFNEDEILKTFVETGKKIEASFFPANTNHCQHCLFNNRCPSSSVKEAA
ncbi:RecB family exonuclease [Elusimicrobium minutum Pei191]|uniref:RecB family exonuclease n=1 Tax=Elusimicrobium minutum (strain Pei191) TaxID=445932 RepID=B2KBW4_ELUMP|nr:PD-(D/E)XK nuclease family protein [Elusimicrobium minutum]ACC97868.1 RecB family exonuclease [Elusimicrobium minutum Pei191]